jgi:O-antigen ligase
MQANQTLTNSIRIWLSQMTRIRRPGESRGIYASSTWLPLAFGGIFGILAAYLILQQNWVVLIAIVMIVPLLLLFFYYPFITVIIWLLIFPFFLKEVMPGGRMVYWLLHRVLIPGSLIGLIGMSILGIRKIKDIRLGLVDALMAAYLVFSFANILMLSDRPISQLIYLYDRIFVPFCMYWLIRLMRPSQMDLNRLAPVALFIIFSQGAIGILSWFAPQVLPDRWLGRLNERTVGTFGNPGAFTTTLLLAAVVLVQTFWHHSHRVKVRLTASLLAVGVAFFFVFFSFSRGSWLGALPLWMGLYILFPKPMIRLTLIGSAALVPLLAFGPLADYSAFAEERLFTETTAEGRVIGGAATLRMVEEKPVFGWGYGNHELYDEQFRDRVLGFVDSNEQTSHNTYLLIAAEMGIPGMILYYLPTAWLLYLTAKNWRRLPDSQAWSRPLVVMLWLLILDHSLVGLFTDMIQSNFFNTTIWWMALGLIANFNDSVLAGEPAGAVQ